MSEFLGNIQAVVFDLDGTLIDSPLSFDQIRFDIGIPSGEFILEYIETLSLDEQAHAHEIIVRHEVEAAKSATLIDGVLDFMTFLKSKNLPLGLLTRNCREVVDRIVEKFQLEFDILKSREDGPAKPNPTVYLGMLASWKVCPERSLYVGDFKFDIDMAKNAGAYSALYIPNDIPDFHLEADYTFNSYAEILQAFQI